MSQLTVPWAALSFGAIASADPLETELTPSSAWVPAWPTGTTVALFEDVATSPRNTAAFMTVTWQPRRGTTDLPFRDADLVVDPLPPVEPATPGEPETPSDPGSPGAPETPETPVPAPSAAGGGSAAPAPITAAPQASQVRGPIPVRLGVTWQRARTGFAKDGLSVRVGVDAPATVEVSLVHTTTSRRGGRSVKRTRKLSRTVTRELQAGRTKLVLPASLTGRTYLDGRDRSVRATLVVVVRSAGRPTRRLTRTVTLTPPR